MWPEKKRRFNFLFRFFSTFSFDVLLLLSKKREKRTDFFTQIFEKQEKKREKKRGGGAKTKFSSSNQNSQRLTISSLLSKTVFKNNTYTKWPRLQRNPRRR
jgi:hypothetical protein